MTKVNLAFKKVIADGDEGHYNHWPLSRELVADGIQIIKICEHSEKARKNAALTNEAKERADTSKADNEVQKEAKQKLAQEDMKKIAQKAKEEQQRKERENSEEEEKKKRAERAASMIQDDKASDEEKS